MFLSESKECILIAASVVVMIQNIYHMAQHAFNSAEWMTRYNKTYCLVKSNNLHSASEHKKHYCLEKNMFNNCYAIKKLCQKNPTNGRQRIS